MPGIKVIIVGSGLGGSLLANGLQREGVEVKVYDRLARYSKREGYQIRLGENALIGFRACLDRERIAKLVAKFGRAGGHLSSAPILRDKQFRTVLDFSTFPSYSKSAPINRSMLRDALADPLFDAGILHYDKSFDRYEIQSDNSRETVRVWFEDGTPDDCDILIGADGAHSKINKQIGLNNISRVETHINFLAKSDLPTDRFLNMSPELHEKSMIMFADNKALFWAAYLPDKTKSSTEPGKAAIAPGEVAFDDSMSSCMFGVWIPVEQCPEKIMEQDADKKWEFLSKVVFHGFAPRYHELLNNIRGVDIYTYKAMASSPVPKTWRDKVRSPSEPSRGHSRVWLLGDAIHAMLPTRGMGGNQAMRDTATMLPILTRLDRDARDGVSLSADAVTAACREYEDEMIPRAFGWVIKSGGRTIMPFDTETWTGWALMAVAAGAMHLYHLTSLLLYPFARKTPMSDAPELRD